MKQLRPDLFSVGSPFVQVHILVEADGLVLVDTGFFGDLRRIQRAVAALGRRPEDLRAILLTHGHFDHVLNAAALQCWSGARLYAPTGDELHLAGRYPYRGAARVCGLLETWGRAVSRYRPPRVDVWMKDGDALPFWGGLRVVALPGHTAGHVGFHSPSKRVLFVGDTFAVSWRIALPPPIFNTDSSQVTASFRKAAAFDVDLFVPAHYFAWDDGLVRRVRERAARFPP